MSKVKRNVKPKKPQKRQRSNVKLEKPRPLRVLAKSNLPVPVKSGNSTPMRLHNLSGRT
jgi:hypothetical protein